MPIIVRYKPRNLTAAQYDAVDTKIENNTEIWPPDGLMMHVCFGPSDALMVSELWESREKLEAFAEHLVPMLEEAGIDITSESPEFFDVHKVDVLSQVTA